MVRRRAVVTDAQVRRLMMLLRSEGSLGVAAIKAGMDEKTARKYRDAEALPSQLCREHDWRTREDSFEQVWPQIEGYLQINAGLEAKSVFAHLQRQEPGRFADGQLRTLQRRFRRWRARSGPAREVFFPQTHQPGQLAESDFTDLSSLGVSLAGRPFDHLIYHFVLTYSNWETVTICFSESFEALSSGLQNALWALGGVPRAHRTDCLSAAVHDLDQPQVFTERYQALLRHYQLEPERTNPAAPHENGDIEQRHWRFTRALDQALMLRGSRDFTGRAEYAAFLQGLLQQLNAGRQARLAEEQPQLAPLPARRCEDYTRLEVRVGRFSTIRVQRNTYSVHSRLIGERLRVHLHADYLELRYAQQVLECLPRLRGHGRHRIDYRHVIDWLVRKPGAFAHYRYRDELFPTTGFRRAYDQLCDDHAAAVATRHYLALLQLAAQRSQDQVEALLEQRLASGEPLDPDQLAAALPTGPTPDRRREVLRLHVAPVDLRQYDALLSVAAVTTAVAG
jgi:hypothetical protein